MPPPSYCLIVDFVRSGAGVGLSICACVYAMLMLAYIVYMGICLRVGTYSGACLYERECSTMFISLFLFECTCVYVYMCMHICIC